MDNKTRAEKLSYVLTKVYNTFSDVKNFIDNSLVKICSREEVPVDQVFFYLLLLLSRMVGFIYKDSKNFISTIKISCFKIVS